MENFERFQKIRGRQNPKTNMNTNRRSLKTNSVTVMNVENQSNTLKTNLHSRMGLKTGPYRHIFTTTLM
jgi:hypothetical protein